jgi:hypothetical protein
VRLGLIVQQHQRAQRLLSAAIYGHVEEFYKEIQNPEFDELSAFANPDWLLLQVRLLNLSCGRLKF